MSSRSNISFSNGANNTRKRFAEGIHFYLWRNEASYLPQISSFLSDMDLFLLQVEPMLSKIHFQSSLIFEPDSKFEKINEMTRFYKEKVVEQQAKVDFQMKLLYKTREFHHKLDDMSQHLSKEIIPKMKIIIDRGNVRKKQINSSLVEFLYLPLLSWMLTIVLNILRFSSFLWVKVTKSGRRISFSSPTLEGAPKFSQKFGSLDSFSQRLRLKRDAVSKPLDFTGRAEKLLKKFQDNPKSN